MTKLLRGLGVAVVSMVLFTNGVHAESEFDAAMVPIVAEYLKIQKALAADRIDGVEAGAEAMAMAAEKLDPKSAPEAHVDHYKEIPQKLTAACAKLKAAGDIDSTRSAFKELSKPVSIWVSMAKPAGKSVMYCPMAKAGWVQQGTEVANPYYGTEMLGCGSKVGGAEE